MLLTLFVVMLLTLFVVMILTLFVVMLLTLFFCLQCLFFCSFLLQFCLFLFESIMMLQNLNKRCMPSKGEVKFVISIILVSSATHLAGLSPRRCSICLLLLLLNESLVSH